LVTLLVETLSSWSTTGPSLLLWTTTGKWDAHMVIDKAGQISNLKRRLSFFPWKVYKFTWLYILLRNPPFLKPERSGFTTPRQPISKIT
jgi:hypothetical protein